MVIKRYEKLVGTLNLNGELSLSQNQQQNQHLDNNLNQRSNQDNSAFTTDQESSLQNPPSSNMVQDALQVADQQDNQRLKSQETDNMTKNAQILSPCDTTENEDGTVKYNLTEKSPKSQKKAKGATGNVEQES